MNYWGNSNIPMAWHPSLCPLAMSVRNAMRRREDEKEKEKEKEKEDEQEQHKRKEMGKIENREWQSRDVKRHKHD